MTKQVHIHTLTHKHSYTRTTHPSLFFFFFSPFNSFILFCVCNCFVLILKPLLVFSKPLSGMMPFFVFFELPPLFNFFVPFCHTCLDILSLTVIYTNATTYTCMYPSLHTDTKYIYTLTLLITHTETEPCTIPPPCFFYLIFF